MATNKVKETVDAVKTEAKETVKKISKKAEPAVEAAKSTMKTVADMAEPAVKKAKSATKSATKAATDAAKSVSKKVAAALLPAVFVEYCGRKFDCNDLVERCKEDYKSKHKAEMIRSCKVYIKPEDGMVYYVINELADKIAL